MPVVGFRKVSMRWCDLMRSRWHDTFLSLRYLDIPLTIWEDDDQTTKPMSASSISTWRFYCWFMRIWPSRVTRSGPEPQVMLSTSGITPENALTWGMIPSIPSQSMNNYGWNKASLLPGPRYETAQRCCCYCTSANNYCAMCSTSPASAIWGCGGPRLSTHFTSISWCAYGLAGVHF
jgi:hypothetical protein